MGAVEANVHTLDKSNVVVLVTDIEGNIVRIATTKMYVDLIIADARRQPWFKNVVIEGDDSPPDTA